MSHSGDARGDWTRPLLAGVGGVPGHAETGDICLESVNIVVEILWTDAQIFLLFRTSVSLAIMSVQFCVIPLNIQVKVIEHLNIHVTVIEHLNIHVIAIEH